MFQPAVSRPGELVALSACILLYVSASVVVMQDPVVMVMMIRVLPIHHNVGDFLCFSRCANTCNAARLPEHGKDQIEGQRLAEMVRF